MGCAERRSGHVVMYGPHEEQKRLGRVAKLVGPKSTNDYYLPFICDLFDGGTCDVPYRR